jgi:adenosylmethionine-8-amino-7-oxononanoate aminotransferase
MKSFCENPLIIESGRGIYLKDINGKTYIDGISGIYTVNIGHGNEYVTEAIRKQQEKISFVAPLHGVSDTTIRYAKRLSQITPETLNTIKLLSGGSEATETAIKFMRQYHRQSGKPMKYKVISLYKGFHGATMGAMSATGLGGLRKNVFGPFLEGFIHIPPPSCFRCPYGLKHPSCNCLCASVLANLIEYEGPDSIGAFLMEPVSNTGGIFTPPAEYFSIVRKICSDYKVMLIFDEVITGMGRTGNWFAAQTFNTAPDLICMGKGMASGYAPLSGVAIRDDLYYSSFWGADSDNICFAHGHTFGGNPISAAAGLATIEVIQKENLMLNGQNIGNHMRKRLEQEVADLGVLGQVRGVGALAAVEFVENMENMSPFPKERRFGKKIERRIIDAGLILRCDINWIAFGPPLNTTISQADEMIDIFIGCLKKELASGK